MYPWTVVVLSVDDFLSRSTALATRSGFDEAIATLIPSDRASFATPKPMPDVPPMTSRVWPEMEGIIGQLGRYRGWIYI